MSQYMLMFSLGPVQSFIAQARKTRDLWLGSFLLSKLMEAGMKDIPSSALVFPADKVIERNIPDLPNKFVALFDNQDEAEQQLVQCKKYIKECWQDICNDIWKDIIQGRVNTVDLESVRTIWDRQTNPDTFFEIFWVITEGNEDPGQYRKWLERTQQALDARKRLRNFSAQLPGEQGEKSTISGEREALHGRGSLRPQVKTFWQNLIRRAYLSPRDISKDGEERLDAIDTIKRFATKSEQIPDNPFPSTSSIATATFVEGLLRGRVNNDILTHWIEATGDLAEKHEIKIPFLIDIPSVVPLKQEILKRDGDCYFQETLTPNRLEKDYGRSKGEETEALAENGREKLRKLVTEAKAKDISRPSSYYAMIQMDGDKMGTLLSGVEGREEHQGISRALSAFSRQSAPKLVEDVYPGRLIYAGGDDVFALAPLARDPINVLPGGVSTVLDLVNRLQLQYRETVAAAVRGDKRKNQVTASTGIAIAHHFTALSYVRRMAKEAEETAKKHYDRNALVVTILRRSGEQTRVGCHWHYDSLSTEEQPVPLFTNFYGWFVNNRLSPKCVYILLEEAVTLVKLLPEAQQSEIKRVLTRQRIDKDNLSDEDIKLAARRIVNLTQAMDNDARGLTSKHEQLSVELHSNTRRYGLVEVLGWLLVMEFLTRKGEE